MQFEESTLIRATAADVFAVYADVAHWSRWDEDLISSKLHGPFATGSTGEVEPKGASKSPIMFCDVLPNHGFAVECKLPLCVMRFEYDLKPSWAPDGQAQVKATHRVIFKGLLKGVFGRVIGSGMRKSLPTSLEALKRVVAERRGVAV
jgi:Polyketide cyclase / dehydrase and lipid transport